MTLGDRVKWMLELRKRNHENRERFRVLMEDPNSQTQAINAAITDFLNDEGLTGNVSVRDIAGYYTHHIDVNVRDISVRNMEPLFSVCVEMRQHHCDEGYYGLRAEVGRRIDEFLKAHGA